MSKLALYFGCLGRDGHAINGGKSGYRPPEGCPWSIGLMDTGLLKNMQVPDAIDGRVFWTCGGKDALWYAFVWWDRSGDSRGNSNSGFYVRGFDLHQAAEAFAYACAEWPQIVERQRVQLVLQP